MKKSLEESQITESNRVFSLLFLKDETQDSKNRKTGQTGGFGVHIPTYVVLTGQYNARILVRKPEAWMSLTPQQVKLFPLKCSKSHKQHYTRERSSSERY